MAPNRPKSSSSTASSSSGKAYSLARWERRPKLIRNAELAAPARNDSNAATPCNTTTRPPSAMWSAIMETMPDMCEVYCCTAKKPPALTAPAVKVRK
ncbi:hypothetical protein D3C77_718190 [compost metagenome]